MTPMQITSIQLTMILEIIGIIGISVLVWVASKNFNGGLLLCVVLLTANFTDSWLCTIGSLFGVYGVYMAVFTFLGRKTDAQQKILLSTLVSILFICITIGLFMLGLGL